MKKFSISHGLVSALDQFYEETETDFEDPELARENVRLVIIKDLNSGVSHWSIEVENASFHDVRNRKSFQNRL